MSGLSKERATSDLEPSRRSRRPALRSTLAAVLLALTALVGIQQPDALAPSTYEIVEIELTESSAYLRVARERRRSAARLVEASTEASRFAPMHDATSALQPARAAAPPVSTRYGRGLLHRQGRLVV